MNTTTVLLLSILSILIAIGFYCEFRRVLKLKKLFSQHPDDYILEIQAKTGEWFWEDPKNWNGIRNLYRARLKNIRTNLYFY